MKENKSVVLLNAVVPTRRLCFYSKSKKRNTWGFTQETDYLSLEGEGGTKYRVRGKVNKDNLICTPSSVLWTSSPSRGKETAHGFTLIELLVVVLIISILAAVAVPQYKKAVLKSRFSNLYPMARSLAQAQESFYLSAGDYAENLSELDVSVPGNPTGKTTTLSDGTQIKLGVEDNHIYVRSEKGDNALMIYQNHSPNFAGETHCEAKQDDTLANWLCEKGLQGTLVGNKYGYTVYSLSPETVGILTRTRYDEQNGTFTDGDVCIDTEGTTSLDRGCLGSHFSNGARCISDTNQPYGCLAVKVDHYGICETKEGSYGNACGSSGAKYNDHSICIGNVFGACYWAKFNSHSSCICGNVKNCCKGAVFANHSVCFGNGENSCSTAEHVAKFSDQSSCVGNHADSCKGSDFKTGSICYANVSGACADSTYDDTSCCAGGENCPDVANRCETKKITVPSQPTVPAY